MLELTIVKMAYSSNIRGMLHVFLSIYSYMDEKMHFINIKLSQITHENTTTIGIVRTKSYCPQEKSEKRKKNRTKARPGKAFTFLSIQVPCVVLRVKKQHVTTITSVLLELRNRE